ncbi:MAG: hypothetical protein ACRETA_00560 [Gammaproteobacteria bacterium]
MKPHIFVFTILLILSMAGLPAMADSSDTTQPPPTQQGHEWCAQHQQECQERMAKHKQWCKDNPQQCKAKMEQHRAKIEAYCKQNPTNERCQKFMRRVQDQSGKAPNPDNSPPPPG